MINREKRVYRRYSQSFPIFKLSYNFYSNYLVTKAKRD